MKILVSGVPRSFGGIGTLIDNMAACNDRQGGPLAFSFLVPEGSPYEAHFRQKGYETFSVPPLRRPLAYSRAVRQAFDGRRYDAVWINNTGKTDMILPTMAQKSGARLITHSHGVSSEERGAKRLLLRAAELLFRRKLFAMIDVPLACSRASAAYFYKGYRHPEQIRIIPNGIRIEQLRFCPEERERVRAGLGLAPEETAICSCGRLTAVKNNRLLIRTLARLPARYRLFLIGKGEEEQMLRRLAEECGVAERTAFLGFREDVRSLLNGMDIYAMPSLHEGMPFSLIEAQANGLPCVVTENISREVKLTDGVHFVCVEEEARWAECMERLSLSGDRGLGAEAVRRAGYGIEDGFAEFKEICLRLKG